MPLTSEQKYYIRKNAHHLDSLEMAQNLGLSEKEVLKFLKKNFSNKKFKKTISVNQTDILSNIENFNFTQLLTKNLGIFIFLSLLVFLIYFNSLGNDFVSDDIAAISKNPDIGNIRNVFSYSIIGSIQKLAYFFAYHLFGLAPWVFRSINILTHLGSTLLIFTIISLLSKRSVAFMTAALFAIHPILTESVTWISGGLYSLYSFFFLLSLLFYINSKNKKRAYFFSILFFFFSLISSEKAMPLFIVFLLFELCFRNLKDNWKKTIPYLTLSIMWIFLFLSRLGTRVSSVIADSPNLDQSKIFNPLVQIPIAIGSYLKLIFWPASLSLYQTEMAFSTGQYMVFLLMTLSFIVILIITFKKNRQIFFWLSFFIASLLLTLTPLKIAWVVAERYVYLGSIGIFVAIAYFFNWMMEKNEKHKIIFYSIFGILILALSTRTIIRNADWKSEDTLWVATAKVAPSGQNIHNNLGDVYARQGDLPRAVEEFKKATEINPHYSDAYHNLANTYQKMQDYDNALANYQKAIEFNPSLWQSYQGMAVIYFNKNDYPSALKNIQKALEINPSDENLKHNLEVIKSKIGN